MGPVLDQRAVGVRGGQHARADREPVAAQSAVVAAAVTPLVVRSGQLGYVGQLRAPGPGPARCGRRAAVPGPARPRSTGGAVPDPALDPDPAHVVQVPGHRTSPASARPSASAAAPARSPTAEEWPCSHGLLRSTRSPHTRATSSRRSSSTRATGSGSGVETSAERVRACPARPAARRTLAERTRLPGRGRARRRRGGVPGRRRPPSPPSPGTSPRSRDVHDPGRERDLLPARSVGSPCRSTSRSCARATSCAAGPRPSRAAGLRRDLAGRHRCVARHRGMVRAMVSATAGRERPVPEATAGTNGAEAGRPPSSGRSSGRRASTAMSSPQIAAALVGVRRAADVLEQGDHHDVPDLGVVAADSARQPGGDARSGAGTRRVAPGPEIGDAGEPGQQPQQPEHIFRMHPRRQRPPAARDAGDGPAPKDRPACGGARGGS